MNTLERTLKLPGSLVREAEAIGLFEPKVIEQVLRDEIRRRRVEQLFEDADRVTGEGLPPLTEAELEAEIEVARRQRNITSIRKEIFRKLEVLSNRYPHWRFGQMVANVSYWAKEPTVEAIWDVEDEEFLNGITSHLEQRDEALQGEPP